MTNFSRCRGFAQSLGGSSLRTQGPITPGLKSDKRPLLQCRNESPRRRDERNLRSRWGPCVRRDDSLKIPYAIALPLRAGLSHVQEHVDEETVVPGGTFEFAAQRGLCIWMSASNVERKSSQNGEVRGSVVLSASRLILVENDVERPVQNVFDAPMFANDAQQFCGRVTLGQKEVALNGLVASTFAGDPCDGLETRKVVLFGHIPDRRHDRGSGFLAAVIGVLGGSLFGLLALCRRDRGLGIAQQTRLVVLYRQDVISAAPHDSFRHPAMTMQRICRDDAALQLKKLEELQSAGRFVVSRRQHIDERHAGLCAPRRHHHWRHVTLAAFVGSSQRLAIESYHALDFGRRRKRLGEAPKNLFEAARIEDAKDTAEGVVARYPSSSTRIVRNSASFERPNSAMSQQVVAPHSVASNAMNSISVRSCCAWFFRGSTNGEKHSAKRSRTVSSRIRRHCQNQIFLPVQ